MGFRKRSKINITVTIMTSAPILIIGNHSKHFEVNCGSPDRFRNPKCSWFLARLAEKWNRYPT
jgi:hypothetical protein